MVDIILPNYNKVGFITESIDSLLSQTFTDWRCIIVDGHSDDGSWEIISEKTKGDGRFVLFQLERNGLYHAWNFGLRKVESECFCILTSDDRWPPNFLEDAISSLSDFPQAIAFASDVRVIDEKGDPYEDDGPAALRSGKKFFSGCALRPGLEDSVAQYFLGPIYLSMHALVCRSRILQHQYFREDLGMIADLEWTMGLGLYGDIIYNGNLAVDWRHYAGQATDQSNRHRNHQTLTKILEGRRQDISEKIKGLEMAQAFSARAKEFDEKYRAYAFLRPTLSMFRKRPWSSFLMSWKIVPFFSIFLEELVFKVIYRKRIREVKALEFLSSTIDRLRKNSADVSNADGARNPI